MQILEIFFRVSERVDIGGANNTFLVFIYNQIPLHPMDLTILVSDITARVSQISQSLHLEEILLLSVNITLLQSQVLDCLSSTYQMAATLPLLL